MLLFFFFGFLSRLSCSMQLKAEIAEFDEASERDSPFVQELEVSIQELSQKIAELNNEQVSLRATFNKMKEESTQLDEKV